MFKIFMGVALPIIAIASVGAPLSVSATTASNNAGSIVKISNTCSDMADVASNNRGSIVKIDGGGQCDINDILKGSVANNNAGSIIKITNVCGNTSGLANNNAGSIIKIESTGPCKKDTPTTVVVTEKQPNQDTTVKTTATASTVAELPQTGLSGQTVGLALTLSGAVYLGAYLVSRTRALRTI